MAGLTFITVTSECCHSSYLVLVKELLSMLGQCYSSIISFVTGCILVYQSLSSSSGTILSSRKKAEKLLSVSYLIHNLLWTGQSWRVLKTTLTRQRYMTVRQGQEQDLPRHKKHRVAGTYLQHPTSYHFMYIDSHYFIIHNAIFDLKIDFIYVWHGEMRHFTT